MRLHSCRPVRVPMLTPVYRESGNNGHVNITTMEPWKKVAWSDESCFLLHHVDGWVRVHLLPGKHIAPGCTMGRSTYLSIAADHVHPFMETLFLDGCGLFQQDNALCYKAEMVQEWFEEHNNQFEMLSWPPNSPDLNPIQHLWDVLDKQVPSMEAPPRNLSEEVGVRAQWPLRYSTPGAEKAKGLAQLPNSYGA
ncbi:hypothetical protein QTP86_025468 [Hemibagrus guttatus]|nr:hypothetical protein QTP86_025468 [Hemibagrus guttatus]